MLLKWDGEKWDEYGVTFQYFSKSEQQDSKLLIFNSKDEIIRTLVSGGLSMGEHVMEWDGKDDLERQVPSGLYYYQIVNRDYRSQRKTIII
jgi:flagellar hook assembly protein FlgD